MKSICENMRSIFDYCMKDIGKIFQKQIKYFPYTDYLKNENETEFLNKILFKKALGTKNSKGIPYRLSELKKDHRIIYNLISSIQSFNGDNWLCLLFMITNHLKHEELIDIFEQKIGNFYLGNNESVTIKNCTMITKTGVINIAKNDSVTISRGMSPNQILEQLNPELIKNGMIYVGDGAIIFNEEIIDINLFLRKCYQNISIFINQLYENL
jgi:hypothetical protein